METITRIHSSATLNKTTSSMIKNMDADMTMSRITSSEVIDFTDQQYTGSNISLVVDKLLAHRKFQERLNSFHTEPTEEQLRNLVCELLRKSLNRSNMSSSNLSSVMEESDLENQPSETESEQNASMMSGNTHSAETVGLDQVSTTSISESQHNELSEVLEEADIHEQLESSIGDHSNTAEAKIENEEKLELSTSKSLQDFIQFSNVPMELCNELEQHLSDFKETSKAMQAQQRLLNERFQAEIERLKNEEYAKMKRKKTRKHSKLTALAIQTVQHVMKNNEELKDDVKTCTYPSDDYYYFRMKLLNTLCYKKSSTSAALNSRSLFCLPRHSFPPAHLFQMPPLTMRPIGTFIVMSPSKQRVE